LRHHLIEAPTLSSLRLIPKKKAATHGVYVGSSFVCDNDNDTSTCRRYGIWFFTPFSISPTVFEFLKSLNLRTIRKDLSDVPPVCDQDLVLYEPSVVRTRSEGGSFVDLTEGMDKPFFNFNPVKEYVDSDGDGWMGP